MLIECIPNVSEGRRPEIVAAMAAAIRAVEGVRLLDHSSDASHNRSVFTMVGDAAGVEHAVLALFERAVADVDRSGQKIGGTRNDSMMLCLKRVLKQATPVELDNNSELLIKALTNGEIDALGANRQRLTTLMKDVPASRLLSDNLFNVPQNIVVPMGKPEVLAAVNAFFDEVRASGFLRDAVAKGGAIGVEAAPKSPGSQHGCPG